MKYLFSIGFMMGLNPILSSQDKNIVLCIDTIYNNNKFLTLSEFEVTVGKQGFLGLGESFDSTAKLNSSIPNYVNIVTLKSDSATLTIPFDDEDGYVEISNIYKTNLDTIRINAIRIYSNCYSDSVYTRIDYYKTVSGAALGDPYKTKQKTTSEKKGCVHRPPLELNYVINGRRYFCSARRMTDKYPEITNFHRYKTKKYLKDPVNYKGPVKYFHGVSIRKHYINVVSLTIKPNG